MCRERRDAVSHASAPCEPAVAAGRRRREDRGLECRRDTKGPIMGPHKHEHELSNLDNTAICTAYSGGGSTVPDISRYLKIDVIKRRCGVVWTVVFGWRAPFAHPVSSVFVLGALCLRYGFKALKYSQYITQYILSLHRQTV